MTPQLSLCGIIERQGQYLVAQRKPGGSQGQKWEFPGGKQEPGESPQQALVREFAEELAVVVAVEGLVFEGAFVNHGKPYQLQAWQTHLLTEDFVLHEHQRLLWAAVSEILALDLSDSDRQVAEFLASRQPNEQS